MKRIAILAALALVGCTPGGLTSVPTSPSVVADKTVLDEQGALAAELAYKAARVAVETGVDAGVIRGDAAARFAVLDAKAYAALGKVRAAYRIGNAATYSAALTEARGEITALLSLAGA